jgi:hypothetical protein
MTNDKINRATEGVRQHGIDYLRSLATNDPAFFLKLIAYVLEAENKGQPPEAPTSVKFVYSQTTGIEQPYLTLYLK